jgi:hypothetical protein
MNKGINATIKPMIQILRQIRLTFLRLRRLRENSKRMLFALSVVMATKVMTDTSLERVEIAPAI